LYDFVWHIGVSDT